MISSIANSIVLIGFSTRMSLYTIVFDWISDCEPTLLQALAIYSYYRMNPTLYILVVLVASCGRGATSQANHTLEHLLCEKQEHGTSFQLLSNVTYVINPGNFCLIENLTNQSFTIYSNGPDPAIIQCNTSDISARGFGFANVDNVTIRNVVIENCGQSLSANAAQYINDLDLFYLGKDQSAVFLFARVGVTLENVVITNYTGYAILGVDVAPLGLHTVTIENSCTDSTYMCSGSGIFLLYTLNYSNVEESSSWVISNSSFSRNSNLVPDLDHPLYWLMTTQLLNHIPILGSAGLTVIFSQLAHVNQSNHTGQYNPTQWTYVNVSVYNCTFNENRGNVAGAVLILHLNHPSSAMVTFSECIFRNNSLKSGSKSTGQYTGYDVTAYHFARSSEQHSGTYECLRIEHSQFSHGLVGAIHSYSIYSIVLLQLTETYDSCRITLEDIHCNTTGCLNAEVIRGYGIGRNLNIELKDIHAVGATSVFESGIFVFINLGIVHILGDSNTFEGNVGSVFNTFATDLHLTGKLVFSNNRVLHGNGGAILLQSNSHLILREPLQVEFENNTATYGGAIYSTLPVTGSSSPFCVLQYSTNDVYTLENITELTSKINFTFTNNSAQLAGNSVYIQPLYNCSVYFTSTVQINQEDMPKLYDSIFLFPNASLNPNGLQEVSSSPDRICFCKSTTAQLHFVCHPSYNPWEKTYPGKEFSLWMVPVDGNYTPVYSRVFVSSSGGKGVLNPNEYVIQIPGTKCTKVNFVFYSREPTWGLLLLQPVTAFAQTYVYVYIQSDCPPGFQKTNNGSCDCISLLSSHDVKCDNNNKESVTIPVNSWIGVQKVSQTLTQVGYASLCPTGYCKKEMRHVNLSKTDLLCSGQRSGILCGECPDHLSLVFGSTDCTRCSNHWLWTVVLYGLAGIALVLFLFILRLTVAAGTVNGLIFYTNVLSTNSLIFLDHRGLRWLLVFVSLVNLDLGFPMCFYDGMDSLAKSCVPPVYMDHCHFDHFSQSALVEDIQTNVKVICSSFGYTDSSLLLQASSYSNRWIDPRYRRDGEWGV